MLSAAENYGASEAWMGNTSLKGSAIHRWQARNNLKAAISSRDNKNLKGLLKTHGSGCQGVRVNKAGDTLLMLAVREQYDEGVGLLLRYNAANPNLTNNSGSSALDLALLGSACPALDMDGLVTLLARITRHVSTNVLTSVLDTEDTDRAVNTVTLLARHSQHYEVRAKLLFTLLQYYPQLLEPVLDHGVDPTSLTDPRMDTQRLWRDVVNLHYFKQPMLNFIPNDMLILLLRASNSRVSIALLADLVLDRFMKESIVPGINDDKPMFIPPVCLYCILHLLAINGHTFSRTELKMLHANLPSMGRWYERLIKQVPTLMALSRATVRGAMNCNALYASRQLPLPTSLQQYLALPEAHNQYI